MSLELNVAVLGATGLVGKQIMECLAERKFPIKELFPLASERSAGSDIQFKDETLVVGDVETFDWSTVDIAFFSAGGAVSAVYAPIAADAGCVVIDNTSHFRYQPDVPLVVPEVNGEALADFRNCNIIANPNCSTIQMVVALKPIYDAFGIERINVSTYQSVSGAGAAGVDELAQQTAALLNGKPIEPNTFARQIAFNCIPQIDEFLENDYTKEEMKMVWETQKIFADDSIGVNATAVRVPVFFGHAEAINIELRQPADAEEIKNVLRESEGVRLLESQMDFPTQVSGASGQDKVLVGRVRADISHAHGMNLWVVADNVRKGAATNSVQIAEYLIHTYW